MAWHKPALCLALISTALALRPALLTQEFGEAELQGTCCCKDVSEAFHSVLIAQMIDGWHSPRSLNLAQQACSTGALNTTTGYWCCKQIEFKNCKWRTMPTHYNLKHTTSVTDLVDFNRNENYAPSQCTSTQTQTQSHMPPKEENDAPVQPTRQIRDHKPPKKENRAPIQTENHALPKQAPAIPTHIQVQVPAANNAAEQESSKDLPPADHDLDALHDTPGPVTPAEPSSLQFTLTEILREYSLRVQCTYKYHIQHEDNPQTRDKFTALLDGIKGEIQNLEGLYNHKLKDPSFTIHEVITEMRVKYRLKCFTSTYGDVYFDQIEAYVQADSFSDCNKYEQC